MYRVQLIVFGCRVCAQGWFTFTVCASSNLCATAVREVSAREQLQLRILR